MAAIVIKQPRDIRNGFSLLGGGPSGSKQIHGVGAFNGTDASGTLIVPGFKKIQHVELTMMGVPQGSAKSINIPLGSNIAATMGQNFIFPETGTVTGVKYVCKETVAADANNFWNWRITNKGQAGAGSANIISPAIINSTQTGGGFSLAAYTAQALDTASSTTLAVVAGDVAELTLTKTAAGTTMSEALLLVTYQASGGTDESLFVQSNSDGTIPISSGAITIQRTGSAKTSGLRFSFTVTGL